MKIAGHILSLAQGRQETPELNTLQRPLAPSSCQNVASGPATLRQPPVPINRNSHAKMNAYTSASPTKPSEANLPPHRLQVNRALHRTPPPARFPSTLNQSNISDTRDFPPPPAAPSSALDAPDPRGCVLERRCCVVRGPRAWPFLP